MAERTREQAEAARIQAVRATELPALREAEARAAAGLQRLTNARETLDREEERAKEARRRTGSPADAVFGRYRPRAAADLRRGGGAGAARWPKDTELKKTSNPASKSAGGVDERVSEGGDDARRRRTPVR